MIHVIIAAVGLASFVAIFIGTAFGILFLGFDWGIRILIASILILILCLILDKLFFEDLPEGDG